MNTRECRYCQREIERCTHRLLHEQLDDIDARIAAATQKIQPSQGVVMITSLISHRNKKPRINIQVGEIQTQMDAEAAIDVAKAIILCASGAYADAFVFNFLMEKVELNQNVALGAINDFREYRESLAEKFRKLQQEP